MHLAEWKRAGSRRVDMKGIDSVAGVDKLATTISLRSTKISAEHKYGLRELVRGCMWTQKRLFDCNITESPECLFCGEEPETRSTSSGAVLAGFFAY